MGILTDVAVLGVIGYIIFEYEKKLQGNQSPIAAPVSVPVSVPVTSTVTPASMIMPAPSVTIPMPIGFTMSTYEQVDSQYATTIVPDSLFNKINPANIAAVNAYYTASGFRYGNMSWYMSFLYGHLSSLALPNWYGFWVPGSILTAFMKNWPAAIFSGTSSAQLPVSVSVNSDNTKTWTFYQLPSSLQSYNPQIINGAWTVTL